jgi:hypothetical protein
MAWKSKFINVITYNISHYITSKEAAISPVLRSTCKHCLRKKIIPYYECNTKPTNICTGGSIAICDFKWDGLYVRVLNGFFKIKIQGEHKVFPWLQTFITRKIRGIQTHNFFFQNVTHIKKFFLQHISSLQHVLLLLHGERLIDNQFLSTCSPTCLQLS